MSIAGRRRAQHRRGRGVPSRGARVRKDPSDRAALRTPRRAARNLLAQGHAMTGTQAGTVIQYKQFRHPIADVADEAIANRWSSVHCHIEVMLSSTDGCVKQQ